MVRNLDYTTKGGFYVSKISEDTDENGGSAEFTVSLSSAPSSGDVTITMASSDTDEGVISSTIGNSQANDNASQLVFTTSNWNAVRTVTVVGQADNLSDGDQNYAIVLTGDNDTSDLRFANVDPADVWSETSITRPKAVSTFRRSPKTPMRTAVARSSR